jgi:hypothetical protein
MQDIFASIFAACFTDQPPFSRPQAQFPVVCLRPPDSGASGTPSLALAFAIPPNEEVGGDQRRNFLG